MEQFPNMFGRCFGARSRHCIFNAKLVQTQYIRVAVDNDRFAFLPYRFRGVVNTVYISFFSKQNRFR